MKKGKVKSAKLLTYLYSVLVVLVSYFIFQYYKNVVILSGDEVAIGTYAFIVYGITCCVTMMLWIIGVFIIWIKPSTYKLTLKAKRFAYHYDRCITAFEDKDYDKVYDTYNKRFKNDKFNKDMTEKLIFAYNIIKGIK